MIPRGQKLTDLIRSRFQGRSPAEMQLDFPILVFCVGNKEIKEALERMIESRLDVGILTSVDYEFLPKFNPVLKKHTRTGA